MVRASAGVFRSDQFFSSQAMMLIALLGHGNVPEMIPDDQRDGQEHRRNMALRTTVAEPNRPSRDNIALRAHGHSRTVNHLRKSLAMHQARPDRAPSPSSYGRVRFLRDQRQNMPQTPRQGDEGNHMSPSAQMEHRVMTPQTTQTGSSAGSVRSTSSIGSRSSLPTHRTQAVFSASDTSSRIHQADNAKTIIRQAQQLTPDERADVLEKGDEHSTSLRLALKAMRDAKAPSVFTSLYYRGASDLEKRLFAAACDILLHGEPEASCTPTADEASGGPDQRRDSAYQRVALSASPELSASPASSQSTQASHVEDASVGQQGSLMASVKTLSTVCNFWQWSIALPVKIEMQVTPIDNNYDVQSILDSIRHTCEDMAAMAARSNRVDHLSGTVPAARPMPGEWANGSCGAEASAMLGGEHDVESMPSAEDAADWLREGIF